MKLKALVINLRRSTDRRERMSKYLAQFSDFLDVEFVEAVDGKMLSESEKRDSLSISARKKREKGLAWSNGEIGCALSHRKCMEMVVGQHIETALILEDDFQLCETESFSEVIETAVAFLNHTKGPSIVNLTFRYVRLPRVLFSSSSQRFSIHRIVGGVSAYAYVISFEGAKKFLKLLTPLQESNDIWEYYSMRGLRCHVIIPPTTTLVRNIDEGQSILQSERQIVWNAATGRKRHSFQSRLEKLWTKRWWYRNFNRYFRGAVQVDSYFSRF